MTVAKLQKLLTRLVEQGHGRKPVLVNKPSFHHNLEDDGCVMLDVCGAELLRIPIIDGDGGTKQRADGMECTIACVVLYGSAHDPGGVV